MYITPRLGENFNQDELYDQNIRFENNTINSFGHRIIWADRVDGLEIRNNIIKKNINKPILHPNRPLFEFVNSRNVVLKNNQYVGDHQQVIKADKKSEATLKNDGSIK
jgi:polygalacturonase